MKWRQRHLYHVYFVTLSSMGNLGTIITTSGSLINLTPIKTRSIANYTTPNDSNKLDVCSIDSSLNPSNRRWFPLHLIISLFSIPASYIRPIPAVLAWMISMSDPTPQHVCVDFIKILSPAIGCIHQRWLDWHWRPHCSATNKNVLFYKDSLT